MPCGRALSAIVALIYIRLFFFIAVPIVTIDGVVGNKAQLPCDIRTADNDDVSMVLWYKGSGNEPIYR